MSEEKATVGIVMGSDSDLKKMSGAAAQLEKFGIGYDISIISAHRDPEKLTTWCNKSSERGTKVIIAGAGMSAALPGVVAAQTYLPVIGVPLLGSSLAGNDSLYSIAQMPKGVPVATVAIDNSKNAAMLAIRILAVSDAELLKKLEDFHSQLRAQVNEKDELLKTATYKNYAKEVANLSTKYPLL